MISAEKDKTGHWRASFKQRQLHLHLLETGGGKNEAKTLLRKRRHLCKRPGAERSRVGQTLMRPQDAFRECFRNRNPVSQVLSPLCLYLFRFISLWFAFPPSSSSCLSIGRLPSGRQNSLRLQVPRATSSGNGILWGSPLPILMKTGVSIPQLPYPDGGTSQTSPAKVGQSCANWDFA